MILLNFTNIFKAIIEGINNHKYGLGITIIGLFFGMANPIYHLPPLILLFPLGLLQIAINCKNKKQAFVWGWLAGTLSSSASIYWLAIPVHNFGYITADLHIPWIVAMFCPLLLGTYLGLFAGLFSTLLFIAHEKMSWLAQGIFAASAWSSLEILKSKLFTGFPWLDLPAAFAPWPVYLQSLTIWGAPGLSALLVLTSIYLHPNLNKNYKFKPLIISMLIIFALFIYGKQQIANSIMDYSDQIQIAMIQPNINQGHKWNISYQRQSIDKMLSMSKKILDKNSTLLIWPETAIPFYLQEKTILGQKIKNFIDKDNFFLLAGGPGYTKSNTKLGYKLYNRAFLINQQGRIISFYDKQHLVPFGEYIPYKNIFPFIKKITAGAADFSPGNYGGPLHIGKLALGILICYEVIFSDLAWQRVAQGSNILVSISNDAWFGISSAPWQHLYCAALRAVEQGRWLIRATNTGISAVIDDKGRILSHSGLFNSEVLTASKIGISNKKTVYHKYYLPINLFFPILFIVIFIKIIANIRISHVGLFQFKK